ncbi:MAG: MBL fold metallo-hydrolase, partial [Candidatus Saccharimonadales bacterium]
AKLPGGSTRIVDRYSSYYPVPIGNSEDLILIDGGLDKGAKKLERVIKERSLGMGAIKAVLLTHVHADHIGAIKAMVDKGIDFKVFVSEEDNEVLQGKKPSDGKLQKLTDNLPRLSAAIPGVETEIIKGGDLIRFGAQLSVRAFALPGHTKGSLGYALKSELDGSSTLYVGDAFDLTPDGVKEAPWLVSGDVGAGRQSIIDLTGRITREGIEIDAVVPAHSGDASFGNLRRHRASQMVLESELITLRPSCGNAY